MKNVAWFFKDNRFTSRSPQIQKIIRDALEGRITKSEFVDRYAEAPYSGVGKPCKRRGAKPAMWAAERLEKKFGYFWKDYN